MVYFVVTFCQGWDKRPWCNFLNTFILKGTCNWELQVCPRLQNFMSYPYRISMLLVIMHGRCHPSQISSMHVLRECHLYTTLSKTQYSGKPLMAKCGFCLSMQLKYDDRVDAWLSGPIPVHIMSIIWSKILEFCVHMCQIVV